MTIVTYGPNGQKITLSGAQTWDGAAPPAHSNSHFDFNPVDILGEEVLGGVSNTPKQETIKVTNNG